MDFNYVITFIDIVLFIWLAIILIRRVVCRVHTKQRFAVLIRRSSYLGDALLLIGSMSGVSILSNSFLLNVDFIHQNLYWLIFRNFFVIGLLIKYRHSQPKLFIHFIEDFKQTQLYAYINKLFQGWNKTSNQLH